MSELAKIRNISIIAHIDAGKTTTSERMLFYSGKTHRIGDIDEGTTVLDYLDEERARGITIVAAAASFPWRDCLVHLIDTPGHIDFTAEVERSLRVIDGAVVIFSGVEGVEAQSEKVWVQADTYRLPRIAFVNKLDRVGASFHRVVADINAKLGRRAVAVQMPVGSEGEFSGVVDLLDMQLLRFGGADGDIVERGPIPAASQAEADRYRSALIDRLADGDDALAERYLAGEVLPAATLRQALRRATFAGQLVPVFAGSAKRNMGIQPLLDGVLDYLPAPSDIPEVAALAAKDHAPLKLKVDPREPFAGIVFKVVASNTGDLYYLRTYTGTLKSGDTLYVPRLHDTLKIKRLLRLYAKNVEPLDAVGPGDIVGLAGPKDLLSGDTLCLRHRPVVFEAMHFPEPVIAMALEPKSSRDKDRLDEVLGLLCREDPTLSVTRDENTGQRLLAGMGELHLEIKVKRVGQEFGLPIKCGEPRVAYRETVSSAVEVVHVFEKTLGDNELYAAVRIALRPSASRDKAFEVIDATRGGMAPPQFVEAALRALSDGLKTGGNAGYPLIYVAAELRELRTDAGKTTDGAVLGAILQALDKAIQQAGTLILEPIMKLEVLCPEDTVGDISNELSQRRGIIQGIHDVVSLKRVLCEVPLAEMFGFSKSLPKLTGGRGSFTMEPCGYKETEKGRMF